MELVLDKRGLFIKILLENVRPACQAFVEVPLQPTPNFFNRTASCIQGDVIARTPLFQSSIEIFTFPPKPFSTISKSVFSVMLLPLFSTLDM